MQFRVQPVLLQQSKFILFLLSPEVFSSCSDHQSPKQLHSWPLTDGEGRFFFSWCHLEATSSYSSSFTATAWAPLFPVLLLPASILANIKFFLLTSKASENRIPAHIKGDYKLFLPSGAFYKRIWALLVLERSTNADKPVGQRHCSDSAGNLKRELPSAPDLGETPWYISARHMTGIPTKSYPSEAWGRWTTALSGGRKAAH